MAKSLDTLMQVITEFTNSQFNQTKSSILVKLKEELSELEQAKESGKHSDEVNEFIDCFHLMLDYASRLELNTNTLINLTDSKLEINKDREWNEPNSDGVIKHKEKIDKEIIHDKLCDIVKEAMYREASKNNMAPNLKATVKKIVELSQRINRWEDKAEAEFELSQLCGLIDRYFPNKLEFARCVLNVDLEKLYIRFYGDPYAKTN